MNDRGWMDPRVLVIVPHSVCVPLFHQRMQKARIIRDQDAGFLRRTDKACQGFGNHESGWHTGERHLRKLPVFRENEITGAAGFRRAYPRHERVFASLLLNVFGELPGDIRKK